MVYHETIPSAINVPYVYTKNHNIQMNLKWISRNIWCKTSKWKYDFTNAKELLLFCNGAWCGQSPESLKELIAIGYPEEKLKWYRGGMQSWLSLGLTTIKP